MYPKGKSFRRKRLEYRWKKFCGRVRQKWEKAKSSAMKKVPPQLRRHFSNKLVPSSDSMGCHMGSVEPPSQRKRKPKPLEGVKIQYEKVPIS